MHESPDARAVARALASVARRARFVDVLRGGAGALAAALGILALLLLGALVLRAGGPELDAAWTGAWSRERAGFAALLLALAGVASGVGWGLFRSRARSRAADLAERSLPASRNVVRTAAELLDGTLRAEPWVARAVCRDAARVLERLDPRQAVPARPAALRLGGALGGWGLASLLFLGSGPGAPLGTPLPTASAPGDMGVEIVVHPPPYTGLAADTLRDPERIQALEGSRVQVTVRARARSVSLETVEGQNELRADTSEPASAGGSPATFRGELAAEADGFVALEARGEDGSTLRRMMGLTVRGDPPPFVEIRDPGRDLLFADGSAALDLVVEASDELGLDSLELVFTRVTGFGEVFDFEEGTVPLEITRESASRWIGRARWPLADLELERGDIVVYHARARDRRPDSAPGESETYMVEIQGSEAGLSGGFAGEDDMDRYALSQQMLLVLTERLVARRDSIPEEAFDAEVQTLSAMQRRIRAEFVFMLGGELEDDLDHEAMGDEALAELHEEAHTRADAAAAEGRLEQQGRLDLTRAVQAMSHAAALLSAVEMEAALEAEESAVIFLQRAFSSSRYILRAMTEREQLDASRRLTGALGSAARDVRPQVESDPEPAIETLREALGRVAELANAHGASGVEEERARTLRDLARSVLAVDPSAERLQAIASDLTDASDALADGRDDAARDRLADAADALVAAIRGGLAPAPDAAPSLEERRLDGALADALSGALGGARTDGGGP